MDKETQQILSDDEEVLNLVKSTGWSIIRKDLINEVTELSNIFNLEDTNPEIMMKKLAACQMATEILLNWLVKIEGRASNCKNNRDLFKKEIKQKYIIQYENRNLSDESDPYR